MAFDSRTKFGGDRVRLCFLYSTIDRRPRLGRGLTGRYVTVPTPSLIQFVPALILGTKKHLHIPGTKSLATGNRTMSIIAIVAHGNVIHLLPVTLLVLSFIPVN